MFSLKRVQEVYQRRIIIKNRACEFRSLILFFSLDIESRTVQNATNLDKTFELLIKRLGRPCFYSKQVYNMAKVEELEV